MPKEMLPIVNKPLIQYGLEEALEAGVTHTDFIVDRDKRAITDHFGHNYQLVRQIKGTSKGKYLGDISNVIDTCDFVFMRQREILGWVTLFSLVNR